MVDANYQRQSLLTSRMSSSSCAYVMAWSMYVMKMLPLKAVFTRISGMDESSSLERRWDEDVDEDSLKGGEITFDAPSRETRTVQFSEQ